MLKAIIIDDEPHNRKMISSMLKDHCEEVSLVGEAEGVAAGLAAIKRYKPDLVLLDIKMEDGTGFDLLEKLGSIDFKLIFVTAYEEYALKAFRFSAIDYILKPIDIDLLVAAIEKVNHQVNNEMDVQLSALADNMKKDGNKRLILKTQENIHLVNINDIIRCEADGGYTMFYLNDERKILVTCVLREYEEMLEEYGFFRVHKSHLINVSSIERFEKADGGTLIMSDTSRVPVSSRKKDTLLSLFERL